MGNLNILSLFYQYMWDELRKNKSDYSFNIQLKGSGNNKFRNDIMLSIERDLLRFFCIILDLSSTILRKDFKPNRLICIRMNVESFFVKFFLQDELCEFSVIWSINGIVQRLTICDNNLENFIKKIRKIFSNLPKRLGVFSLQNCLDAIYDYFQVKLVSGSKEVLVILNASNTIDPGDLFKTIKKIKSSRIKCSVISLSSEIYVFKELTRKTNGSYSIAIDNHHFRKLLFDVIPIMPIVSKVQKAWLQFGFPPKIKTKQPLICSCHHGMKNDYYV